MTPPAMITGTAPLPTPWLQEWPAQDLEAVPTCPVCGDDQRALLHAGLVDNAFFSAPGRWNLQQCGACGVAYLDPRPSAASLHRAYASYYTHQQPASQDTYDGLNRWRRMRRQLVNGYTRARFGTADQPASALGTLVARALPGLRAIIERKFRHLPPPDRRGRLLDLGCGDGSYLALARSCGWQVEGLDPDAGAVANAARLGLHVRQGGIEQLAGERFRFDVITLCHVIEHVPNPVEVLAACHALLKPGGQLWLETPNIDCPTHACFQADWRGLEAPRHLVLFNRIGLHRALGLAGFHHLRDCARPAPCRGMFRISHAMSLGLQPEAAVPLPVRLRLRAALAALIDRLRPARREFHTLIATKGH